MNINEKRKSCPNCGRKTFFGDNNGLWICSFCHYQESDLVTCMIEMSKASDIGDWKGYNKAKDRLNEITREALRKDKVLQKRFENEAIYPKD